jgi:hypothetical protein
MPPSADAVSSRRRKSLPSQMTAGFFVRGRCLSLFGVMAGLVPAIHVLL